MIHLRQQFAQMAERKWALLIALGCLVGGLLSWPWSVSPGRVSLSPQALAAPAADAPLQAGCYLVTPESCGLSVQPYTLPIANDQSLIAFQLLANNQPLYDFHTDADRPPAGPFSPSATAFDFAVGCSASYTLTLLVRTTGQPAGYTAGQAKAITCPARVYIVNLPALKRKSP